MDSILNIKLTNKRSSKTSKVLKALHSSTINAVLNQANSIEEFEVLREGLALDDTPEHLSTEYDSSSS